MGPPQYFTAGIPGAGYDPSASNLTGGKQFRRQATVETTGDNRSKRRRVTLRHTTERSGLNNSQNRHESQVYDAHLLANQGPQRHVSLSMKIGKNLGVLDRNGPFLAMLNQKGKIVTAWNGTLKSEQDKRHVSMQVFRHQYSDDDGTGTIQKAYPQSVTNTPHILYPQSVTAAVTVSGSPVGGEALASNPPLTDVPGDGDKINQPFYLHADGEVSFAPVNLPDLEDMSWNLNRLKLGASNTQNPNPSIPPLMLGDVANYRVNEHRRQSQLRQHNWTATLLSALSPTTGNQFDPDVIDKASVFKFDSCLRHGLISYEFMNKNDTGATIEVIVYRVKKNANLSPTSTMYQSAVTSSNISAYYPLNVVASASAQGYVNTVGANYATENFQGRIPEFNDVYGNPSYPLLPVLRKTVEGTNPLVEVMRNKFAMTAGSRRSLNIHLPGKLYDPSSKQKILASSALSTITPMLAQNIPCIDEDAYCVVLAVNGQKMTRFFDSKPKAAGNNEIAKARFPAGNIAIDPTAYPIVTGINTFYVQSPTPSANGENDAIITMNFQTGVLGGLPATFTSFCQNSPADIVIVNPGSGFIAGVPANVWSGPNGTGYQFSFYAWINGTNFTGPFGAFMDINTVLDHSTALPMETPMGDNHGSSLVNYCATYTEHLGACVYKDSKERNLYDCGQPVPPSLDASASAQTGSSTGSRMILPATSVVRQARRVGYSIDVNGDPENPTAEGTTYTSGVHGQP